VSVPVSPSKNINNNVLIYVMMYMLEIYQRFCKYKSPVTAH